MAEEFENEIDKVNEELSKTRYLFGRRVIYSDVEEVTADNVLEVLNKALMIHEVNREEIAYLDNYYRGNQPIIYRVKDVRPEINNKVVVNRAKTIVDFKTGYLCGEPIQYVNRKGSDDVTDQINTLNEFMFSEDKSSQDSELVEWGFKCGTSFRLVLPDDDTDEDPDEAPFELYTLNPKDTFVVYSSDIGHKPLMGVKYRIDENGVAHYSIYTDKMFFNVESDKIVQQKPHALGCVPIFEYPANNTRQSAFEQVLPILDAINKVQSNRMDGVEQIVQAFMKFINCDITVDEYKEFLKMGAIKVKSVDGQNADVDMVTTSLDQNQTQTLINDLWQEAIEICSMPNRNGGSSTSDTGAAVIMRDGWSDAEADAKNSEQIFKRAEKKALKLVLRICNESSGTKVNLKLSDIDIKFTRRNYENIQSKSQVLVSMLQNPKIAPELAFQTCGLFSDPESAYALSQDYYDDQMEKWNPQPVADDEDGDTGDGQNPQQSGQNQSKNLNQNKDKKNVRSNGQVSGKTQKQNQS